MSTRSCEVCSIWLTGLLHKTCRSSPQCESGKPLIMTDRSNPIGLLLRSCFSLNLSTGFLPMTCRSSPFGYWQILFEICRSNSQWETCGKLNLHVYSTVLTSCLHIIVLRHMTHWSFLDELQVFSTGLACLLLVTSRSSPYDSQFYSTKYVA